MDDSSSQKSAANIPLTDILRESTCPACGHHVATPFFDGGQLPLTTLAWPTSAEQARSMPRLPHDFLRCVDCGHIYNCKFDYANVPYSDKPNLMFNSGTIWSKHLQDIHRVILDRLPPDATLVEIGCGEGHLLRAVAQVRPDVRCIGFDPNSTIETENGKIEARAELFLPTVHLQELRPDLLVSRHVLEHLMNPLGFIQQLQFAASWHEIETSLLIEVPCVDHVLKLGRTVDFFYEHNSHFTTVSLRRMLERCSSEVQLIDTGYGGEVVFGLCAFQPVPRHIANATASLRFRSHAVESARTVKAGLAELVQRGIKTAIWGGTGKAAAFINQYGLTAEHFPIVVDSDRNKVGTYVPGMGQDILFRDHLIDHPVDVVIVATQWRAADIVCEMQRCGIECDTVLLEHQGRLVDFHRDPHPYRDLMTHASQSESQKVDTQGKMVPRPKFLAPNDSSIRNGLELS